MRITGWILLIAGALLCATIDWATIGFLLMGIGLLSLLVAENNRRRASRPIARTERVQKPMAAPPPIPKLATPPPLAEPVFDREAPKMPSAPARSYDRQAWRRLVESDADLAGVALVLADYGQQYVDELAREYLADPDKKRLPEIVDGIIGRAGKGVAPQGVARSGRASSRRARLALDTRSPNLVGGADAAAHRPDQPPAPLPEVKPKLSEKLFEPVLVEAAQPEAVGAPIQPPVVVDPTSGVEDRTKTIVSADEELTAMLGKLSPDAATPKS